MCPLCILITADHIRLMGPMALAWNSCKMTIHTFMISLLCCNRFVGFGRLLIQMTKLALLLTPHMFNTFVQVKTVFSNEKDWLRLVNSSSGMASISVNCARWLFVCAMGCRPTHRVDRGKWCAVRKWLGHVLALNAHKRRMFQDMVQAIWKWLQKCVTLV